MAAAGQGTEVARRLYYDSAALDFTATVADIRLDSRAGTSQLWQLALDETAFYPEGGGQPWDTGVLVAVAPSGATLEVPVERVEEDEHGEVWHYVRKPLVAGTEVTGWVDSARRVDHEQQHTGQHLLSAMFLREVGARTVSFHLGVESSTIDLVLRDGAERLSSEELERVEEAANRVVMEGRNVMSHWVERGLAEAMLARGDLRKLPEREGPLRIVQMQGIEFNACGGTHVSNTGAIGPVLVRKVEKVKQGWRVEFCCGFRAVRCARHDFGLLGSIAQTLSVGAGDVPARVAALIAEGKAAAKERKALLEELASAVSAELVAAATEDVVRGAFVGRDIDFAKKVAAKIVGRGRAAVVSVENSEDGIIVIAREPGSQEDCGELIRMKVADSGGSLRGGGSAELAQCLCAAGQVDGIAAALAIHLRGSGWLSRG